MTGSRGEVAAEALAATQHGVLTRDQALEAGMCARTIVRRVASGRWRAIHATVYRPAAAPPTWRSEVMAAVLWAGSGAMASHRAAAALLGLEGFVEGPVEIVARTGRTRPGLVVHRLRPEDRPRRRWSDAIPVTAPDRTLLDLASVASPGTVGVALDDALRRGLVTLPQLRRLLDAEGAPGRRGTRTLRTLLEVRRVDRRTESELERRFVAVLRRAGLPRPSAQHEVRSSRGLVARLDFAYPELRLGVETHGYLWHGGPERWRRDIRREDRLKRMGWTVLVFTWDDVVGDPGGVAGEVAAALAARTVLQRGATGGARREKSA